MSKVLVTGTNRGIGLELCKQLKSKGDEVIAVCRKASKEIVDIADLVIEQIDVASDECVEKLSKALVGHSLDIVINNAGLLEGTALEDTNAMLRQFQVNTLGPLRVVRACLPFLKKGSRILNVTSRMGSIEDNTSGGSYGYRMSKAALNIVSVSLAHDLKEKGIAVGLVHPGYVKTDMTGHLGHILPEESAVGILGRLEELTLETAGTFKHANGETLPW